MGADHPISLCKDYEGGRSFYTGARHRRRRRSTRSSADAPRRARSSWAAGQSRPGLQRLRRDRARELPADQDLGAAEPERADRLRPAPRRPHPPDRPPRRAAPARPGQGHDAGHRRLLVHEPADHAARVHELRGRALRPGGGQRLRHQQVGLPVLRAADGHRSRSATARSPRSTTRHGAADRAAADDRRGIRYVAATSSSRASSSSTARPARRRRLRPREPSRRSSRWPTTVGACCHVAGDIDFDSTTTCGSSPATTRRPAAATPAASRPINDQKHGRACRPSASTNAPAARSR